MLRELVLRQTREAPDFDRHGRRIAETTTCAAVLLGLPVERCRTVWYAALLHDFGKLQVPRDVLDNPGDLTAEEWRVMRGHVEHGTAALREAGEPEVAAVVAAHHERPDGTGYPRGFAAGEIPVEARLLAVADSYYAMLEARSYRPAMTHGAALFTLRRGIGTQYDEQAVRMVLAVLTGPGVTANSAWDDAAAQAASGYKSSMLVPSS